jgi:hypothetical protein
MHDTHGTTLALVRGYLPILSINTPEIGEITTLGKAVADMSIPTWKEVKPASETVRVHASTQHTARESAQSARSEGKESAVCMRVLPHRKAESKSLREKELVLRRGAVEPIMTSAK